MPDRRMSGLCGVRLVIADREVQQETGRPVVVISFAREPEWLREHRGAAQATPHGLKNSWTQVPGWPREIFRVASCTLYLLPNSEAESHDPERRGIDGPGGSATWMQLHQSFVHKPDRPKQSAAGDCAQSRSMELVMM